MLLDIQHVRKQYRCIRRQEVAYGTSIVTRKSLATKKVGKSQASHVINLTPIFGYRFRRLETTSAKQNVL